MTENRNRGGYRWRQTAARFRSRCAKASAPCWLCGQPIDYSAPPQTPAAFEADHYHPVATHPHLAYMTSNLRPAHSSCNRSRGSKTVTSGPWVTPDW